MSQLIADEPGLELNGAGKASIESGEEWVVPGDTAPADTPKDQPPAAQRPEHIPEKFWTGDLATSSQKMAEAYAKLEAARGDASADEPAASDDTPADEPASDDAPADNQQSVIDNAMAAFEKDGKLGDEHYEALEKQGVPRETVDAYISNLQATTLLAHTAAGGEENFKSMVEWAAKALTPAEIETFNSAIQSPSTDMVAAVQGLAARFAAESSTEPKLVTGEPAPVAPSGFASKGEMVSAMSDPRYKTDAAFRAEVERKVASAQVDLWS